MRRRIPSMKTLRDAFAQQMEHDYGGDRTHASLTVLRNTLIAWRDGLVPSQELLDEANDLLKGHGIEHLESENARAEAYYVNMGDTYNATLLLDLRRDKVWATDWGSWLEAEERAGNRFA